MLKLLQLKSKNYNINYNRKEGDYVGKHKYFPVSSQEWSNSIYSYNKNTTKLLPVTDNVVTKLIKGYFYMYNKKLESKANISRLRIWMRRLSSKKIIVSKPTFKHTNDKVIITLFIYNREYNYYLNKLKNTIIIGFNKLFNFPNRIRVDNKEITVKILDNKISVYNIRFKHIANKLKSLHSNFLNKISNVRNLGISTSITSTVNFSKSNLYKSYISKVMEKEILFMYIKQLMFFNNYKFKDTYILPLKSLIEIIYGKKVEFNLITLKNYYFNSSIYTQIIALKAKNRRNKILRVLKTSLRNIYVPNINKELLSDITSNNRKKQNVIVNNMKISELNSDYTNVVLNSNYKSIGTNKTIIDDLKYKNILGIRIEASGRLTKRMTAARSLFKVKYKGTLKNIDSSYKGISSLMLRGYQKSNIQYTKLNSKSRVGSFGIKGWINSN